MRSKEMGEFEKEAGYIFKDKSLLATALTHSSFSNEKKMKKTELEALGLDREQVRAVQQIHGKDIMQE